MTISYFPFDTGVGANANEERWRDMMKWMRTTGILSTNQPLSTSTSDCYVEVNMGMQLQVHPGLAWVNGFYFSSTAIELINISPNPYSDPRIDLVCIRLSLIADDIVFAVLEGTPAMSPVAPSPQQDDDIWEFPICQVDIPAMTVSLTSMDLTDVRVPSYQGNTGSSPLTAGSGVTISYVGDNVNLTSP